MRKLKGKCKKCVGCNKIFEKGFAGVKRCKYYTKRTIFNSNLNKEENKTSFIVLLIFEIFVIIAFMYFIYRIFVLSVGG